MHRRRGVYCGRRELVLCLSDVTGGACWLAWMLEPFVVGRQRNANARIETASLPPTAFARPVPAVTHPRASPRPLCSTVRECFWTGNRQMRWTRAVYAAGLGERLRRAAPSRGGQAACSLPVSNAGPQAPLLWSVPPCPALPRPTLPCKWLAAMRVPWHRAGSQFWPLVPPTPHAPCISRWMCPLQVASM